MSPIKNKKRSNDAAESSSKKKTPGALKAKRRLVKKFSNSDSVQTKEPDISQLSDFVSVQTKETEISPQVQAGNYDEEEKKGSQGNHAGDANKSQNMNRGNKETENIREKCGEVNKDAKTEKRRDINEKREVVNKDAKAEKRWGLNGKREVVNQGNKETENISEKCGEVNKDAKTEKRRRLNEKREVVSKDTNTEKRCGLNGKLEVMNKDVNNVESLGGVIFMCNAKTKADCFRYRVMGISANRQDFVMGIKPGIKLFLFDFDLKLMYGVYEASSAGGMRLAPAAFGGAFPAQVPFKILKDCLPLPENVFKKAIKENYDGTTRKFKTALTVKQVEKLTELFKPAPWLQQQTVNPVLNDPAAPVTQQSAAAHLSTHEPSREHVYGTQHSNSKAGRNFSPYDRDRQQLGHQPHFPTEKEYRSYGLTQQARHLQPSASGAAHVSPKLDHYDPLFQSEREYRTYGLKSSHGQPATAAPTVESSAGGSRSMPNHAVNPYDESTDSLVNRYLSMAPRTTITPSLPPRAMMAPGRLPAENVRFYPPNVAHELSDQAQRYHYPRDEPGKSSVDPIRYPFPGPSASRR